MKSLSYLRRDATPQMTRPGHLWDPVGEQLVVVDKAKETSIWVHEHRGI